MQFKSYLKGPQSTISTQTLYAEGATVTSASNPVNVTLRTITFTSNDMYFVTGLVTAIEISCDGNFTGTSGTLTVQLNGITIRTYTLGSSAYNYAVSTPIKSPNQVNTVDYIVNAPAVSTVTLANFKVMGRVVEQ